MAENDEGQERSEQPTEKRLREARERGQVARSRELGTFLVLTLGAGLLFFLGGWLAARLYRLAVEGWTLERELILDENLLVGRLVYLSGQALLILAPLFVALMLAALISQVAVGGVNVSAQAVMPQFSRLNPLSGLKRIFSIQGLIELLKGLAKFFLVAAIAFLGLRSLWGRLLLLDELPLETALVQAVQMAGWLFLIASASLVIVAAIDVPFQIWNHQRQLRMTLQEIKDEFKETEGKPEVKSRIRQLQHEMARRRMMAEVPKADVIITNPTHYAVALAYVPATMSAPKLLAKGVDRVALAIRKLGEEHGIVCVEAPRVARAIYLTTDLGQEIPSGLFIAVARILAYVYQIRRDDPDIELPEELPVPEDYLDPRRALRLRRVRR